jgi:hypothetical protein
MTRPTTNATTTLVTRVVVNCASLPAATTMTTTLSTNTMNHGSVRGPSMRLAITAGMTSAEIGTTTGKRYMNTPVTSVAAPSTTTQVISASWKRRSA